MLKVATAYRTGRNTPYGPADWVINTLGRHALPCGLSNLTLEVCSDLAASPVAETAMAAKQSRWLAECSPSLGTGTRSDGAH